MGPQRGENKRLFALSICNVFALWQKEIPSYRPKIGKLRNGSYLQCLLTMATNCRDLALYAIEHIETN